MFVIVITYTAPAERVDAVRPEHREWLEPHVRSGLLLVTGPMASRTGGVLIARGGMSREAMEALVKEDPFQVQGVADHQVIEFEPNKIHPALAALV